MKNTTAVLKPISTPQRKSARKASLKGSNFSVHSIYRPTTLGPAGYFKCQYPAGVVSKGRRPAGATLRGKVPPASPHSRACRAAFSRQRRAEHRDKSPERFLRSSAVIRDAKTIRIPGESASPRKHRNTDNITWRATPVACVSKPQVWFLERSLNLPMH